MYRKSYCNTLVFGVGGGSGAGVGVSKMFKFYVEFYVMGKALPGELSYTRTGHVVIHIIIIIIINNITIIIVIIIIAGPRSAVGRAPDS